MTRLLATGALLASGISVLLLTGCAAPAPAATPEPTATASPRPTPDPAVEATPATLPAATCDTVLTEAEYASLAEDGLVLNEGDIWILGPAMEDLAADGALTCEWHGTGGGDISVWYAELAEDDTAWGSRRAGLEASGWIVLDDPVAGTLLAPPDYDANYQPSMLHADGVTYFTSYAAFLSSVSALQ